MPQPIKVVIQKDCALGETLMAEVHVDPRNPKSEQDFVYATNLLDQRLVQLNFRVADAMKLEQRFGPEVAAQIRSVVEVLLGHRSLADFERQKDLAPAPGPGGEAPRENQPEKAVELRVLDGGKK